MTEISPQWGEIAFVLTAVWCIEKSVIDLETIFLGRKNLKHWPLEFPSRLKCVGMCRCLHTVGRLAVRVKGTNILRMPYW